MLCPKKRILGVPTATQKIQTEMGEIGKVKKHSMHKIGILKD